MNQPRSARELFEHFVTQNAAAPHPDAKAIRSNTALVHRYFEMWSSGDGAVADEVLGSTYLDHAHPEVIGPAAVRSLVPRFHLANPDAHMAIEVAAADGELVAVRNTITRTSHGQTVVSEGVALFRIAAGKLVEQWSWYPEAEAAHTPPAARASLDAWLSFRA